MLTCSIYGFYPFSKTLSEELLEIFLREKNLFIHKYIYANNKNLTLSFILPLN